MSGVVSVAPRRMTPEERRQQILHVACELLDSRPVDEISVESVAVKAGVSPGLLFHYFGTQRRFRHAVVQAAAWELLAQVEPDPALSPAAQLRTGLAAFTAYIARRPGLYRAVVSDSGLRNLHRTVRGVLAGWLITGLASVDVPVTPAVTATVAGWLAFTEEVLLRWLAAPSRMTQDELVTLCERACYRLVESAIDDPALWSRAEQSIRAAPPALTFLPYLARAAPAARPIYRDICGTIGGVAGMCAASLACALAHPPSSCIRRRWRPGIAGACPVYRDLPGR
jgi:AcrR family transcriptional regulator